MFNPLSYKAAVLDFDGTIADSMPSWGRADRSILNASGIEPDQAFMISLIPLSETECARLMQEKGVRLSIEEIIKRKHEFMREAYGSVVELKSGIIPVLDMLQSAGIPMIVFSSTPSALIKVSLRRHGLEHYFKEVISASERGLSKARPESFVSFAEAIGFKPSEISFYDDNVRSLHNAKAAGIATVGVYDEYSAQTESEIRGFVDCYVKSWETFLECSR